MSPLDTPSDVPNSPSPPSYSNTYVSPSDILTSSTAANTATQPRSGPGSSTAGPPPLDDKSRYSAAKKPWIIGIVAALVAIIIVLAGVLGSGVAKRGAAASAESNSGGGTLIDGSSGGGNNGGGGGNSAGSPTVSQGNPTTFAPKPGSPTTFAPKPGETATQNSQPESSPTSVDSNSICHGRVCLSVLAVAQFSDPPRAFILGRGKDSAVWYRQMDGEKWVSNWESLGGNFASQPAASSGGNGMFDVFGSERNNTIQFKSYGGGAWDPWWKEMGKGADGAPFAVVGCGTEQDLAIMNGGTFWRAYRPKPTGSWTWENHGGPWAPGLVVSCWPGPFHVAAAGYRGAQNPLYVRTWFGGWVDWMLVGGGFRGNLAIASRNTEESLVFGITSNLTMQYHNWTRANKDLTQLIDLGESFQLKHRALIGQTWATGWQDLGGAFNSTPAAITVPKGKVSVFGLGVNGTLFHGTWSTSKSYEWTGNGDWRLDDGPLALGWYEFDI
ncbi:hypothetical protein B0H63DRAFT_537146 [Podospora didyma]|uniref:Fucose-specific lectin n=1 Tax=Podospora didyma TaxID=330526 RepID=A0AAE0NXA1_9PEZI|nr:hypothetical protein B0H63DRAFT_537146 [Podospora didyma]